jgi:hypothetical protein
MVLNGFMEQSNFSVSTRHSYFNLAYSHLLSFLVIFSAIPPTQNLPYLSSKLSNLICYVLVKQKIRKIFFIKALFALRAFGFLITKIKITIPKINIFPIPLRSFSILSLLFRISSVFMHYFSPFLSLTLSPFATSILHRLNSLSVLIASSAPSFLSFHPIPVFSLLVPTSKSCHHFSFSCTLSPQVLRNFLCHTPFIIPVGSGFFNSFPSFLLGCVLSLSLSSIFINLPFALNLSTGIPVSLKGFLSLLLLRDFFLFSPAFR